MTTPPPGREPAPGPAVPLPQEGIEAELVERAAAAAWNLHATVPWDEFFRDHPEHRAFYLDSMRAALAAIGPLIRGPIVLPLPAGRVIHG